MCDLLLLIRLVGNQWSLEEALFVVLKMGAALEL